MSDSRKKGSVVIVEDDMLLSMVQTRMVERLGYTVVGKAVNGEDAIRVIKENNPDVVIMDISLKGSIDGIDAVTRVRSFSDVPVIYLSGNSDKLSKERARKTGCIDFLVKPIHPREISTPLERAIEQQRSQLLSHAS
jgi:CheY-like chemotaxis protein